RPFAGLSVQALFDRRSRTVSQRQYRDRLFDSREHSAIARARGLRSSLSGQAGRQGAVCILQLLHGRYAAGAAGNGETAPFCVGTAGAEVVLPTPSGILVRDGARGGSAPSVAPGK